MATTEKLSVTLNHEDVSWAREQARERKLSFSAVISEAVRQARQYQARKEYLEWALEGQPPLTGAEMDEAERILYGDEPTPGSERVIEPATGDKHDDAAQ